MKEVEIKKIRECSHRISHISIGRQNACFVLILHSSEKSAQPVLEPLKKGPEMKLNKKYYNPQSIEMLQKTADTQADATRTHFEPQLELKTRYEKIIVRIGNFGDLSVERENSRRADGADERYSVSYHFGAVEKGDKNCFNFEIPESMSGYQAQSSNPTLNNTQNELKTHFETAENICQLLKQILCGEMLMTFVVAAELFN